MSEENDGEAGERVVVPIVEEQIVLDKKAAEGRTVNVTTRIVDETKHVAEPVMRETVSVERIAVNRPVASYPEVREKGDVTIIPVVEERLVVSKQLVLTEEIHLRRTRQTATEARIVEVKKTEVEITASPPHG